MEDTRIKEFRLTGEVELNIEEVIRKWNKNTHIVQCHDTYRLVEYIRKDSNRPKLKVEIYTKQAKELIKRLNLKQYKSDIFNNGSTWRREE